MLLGRPALHRHLFGVLEFVGAGLGLVATLDLMQLHLVEAGANYAHAVVEIGGQLAGGVDVGVLSTFLLDGFALVIDVLGNLV